MAVDLSLHALLADFSVRRSDDFVLELALEVPPGTTMALLGPNGAGKSTAVAAIAGLLPVDTGRIELGGSALDDADRGVFVLPEDRGVGVVFQDYLLFPQLDVLENIAFGLRSRGVGREASRETAREMIARMGLEGLESRRPAELSGGQAQCVALARALVIEPSLLLLDEPLAALDVSTRGELRRSLAEHLEVFPGPRLFITHDPTEAFLFADEVCLLEEGRVTQTGTPDEIRIHPRTHFAADLAGANLFRGDAAGGQVTVGEHVFHIGDFEAEGSVLLVVHPSAISVHNDPPHGSPRNTWETTIEMLEVVGERARLRTTTPPRITAEVTKNAMDELGLAPGKRVWLAVKATEIRVEQEG